MYEVPVHLDIFLSINLKLTCQFRTVYPLTIVPATVNEAKIYYDNLSSLWRIELNLKVFDGAKIILILSGFI